jgi:D-3-phosphoglycerate dehydrogenase / 2-oxoglutarate reductase
VIATPHIGGSTEEAQEIVGVRIAEQLVEYLLNGVALNAVNMPAMSADQYRAVAPFISLAERSGISRRTWRRAIRGRCGWSIRKDRG